MRQVPRSLEQVSLKSLYKRARQGHVGSWMEIHDRMVGKLEHLALRYLGMRRRVEAARIAAEAVGSLALRLKEIEEWKRAWAYLLGTTMNLIRKSWKRRAARVRKGSLSLSRMGNSVRYPTRRASPSFGTWSGMMPSTSSKESCPRT